MTEQQTPQRFAAFLRAINVGGAHRLPMAEVRVVLNALGASDVATYIQSGNIVFTGRADGNGVEADGTGAGASGARADGTGTGASEAEVWAARIAAALGEHAGFPVPTTVLAAADLTAARSACPFAPDDPRFCHLILLAASPPAGVLDEIRGLTSGTDTEVAVEGATAYLLTPGGLSASRPAAAILRRLGGTARNLRTIDALLDRI